MMLLLLKWFYAFPLSTAITFEYMFSKCPDMNSQLYKVLNTEESHLASLGNEVYFEINTIALIAVLKLLASNEFMNYL